MRALSFFALAPGLMAWMGFVVMKLWGWFAVPAGFRPLTVAWAYGLVCLVGAFSFRAPRKDDSTEALVATITRGLVGPLVSLAFGWLAHEAMGIGW